MQDANCLKSFNDDNDQKNQRLYQYINAQYDKPTIDYKYIQEQITGSSKNDDKKLEIEFQKVLPENKHKDESNLCLLFFNSAKQSFPILTDTIKSYIQKEQHLQTNKNNQNLTQNFSNLQTKQKDDNLRFVNILNQILQDQIKNNKSLKDANFTLLQKIKSLQQTIATFSKNKKSQKNIKVTLSQFQIKSQQLKAQKIKALQIEVEKDKDVIYQLLGTIQQLENQPKIINYEQRFYYDDNPQRLVFQIVKFMDDFFVSGDTLLKFLYTFSTESRNHQQIHKDFQDFLKDVSRAIGFKLFSKWKIFLIAQINEQKYQLRSDYIISEIN